jgi:hypothetical protein
MSVHITASVDFDLLVRLWRIVYVVHIAFYVRYVYQDLSSDSSLPKKQLVALEENEQRIRLALAKNLALAITKVRTVHHREGV